MSSSFRSFFAATAIIVLAFIATHPAKADTYRITVVDNFSQNETFLGIDDKGDFVVTNLGDNAIKCGELPGGPCFEVFLVGQSPFFTTTAPVLAFDNGASCTVVLDASFAPQSTAPGICNNGHEIFSTFPFEVFDGPDVSDLLLFGGNFGGGFINANGDAVFTEDIYHAFNGELIFAQDLTTRIHPRTQQLASVWNGLCLDSCYLTAAYTLARFVILKNADSVEMAFDSIGIWSVTKTNWFVLFRKLGLPCQLNLV